MKLETKGMTTTDCEALFIVITDRAPSRAEKTSTATRTIYAEASDHSLMFTTKAVPYLPLSLRGNF